MDPTLSPLIDVSALTAADHAALVDVAAGRSIDSDAMAARLGGWHVARDYAAADDAESPPRPRSTPVAHERDAITLCWTDSAASECERIWRLVTALDDVGGARLAAAMITAMVRLIVEGRGRPQGIADVPLLPPLGLRILVSDEGIVVLGLRNHTSIR